MRVRVCAYVCVCVCVCALVRACVPMCVRVRLAGFLLLAKHAVQFKELIKSKYKVCGGSCLLSDTCSIQNC